MRWGRFENSQSRPPSLRYDPNKVLFKSKLAAVLAVLNGVSVGLAYIVSQGNNNGNNHMVSRNNRRNTGLSYYKEQD
jgi:hypothetical protein